MYGKATGVATGTLPATGGMVLFPNYLWLFPTPPLPPALHPPPPPPPPPPRRRCLISLGHRTVTRRLQVRNRLPSSLRNHDRIP
jgi:hypothetical protein